MATLELEPEFVKGLKCMFASSREGSDALRAMLDDAIRTKYGTSKSLGTFQHTFKLDEDLTSLLIMSGRNSDDSRSSKDAADDDDELNLEDMMEDDLTCVVCKDMNVGPRNRLVECLECHALYHQECHRPIISDQDISDPRNTWYCSACSRNLHKSAEVATSTSTSIKQPPPTSSKSSGGKPPFKSSSTSSSSKSSRSDSSDKSSLFKRSDKTSSSSSSKSGQSGGLAAFAASLQNPKSSSSSGGSSSHKSSSGNSSKSSSSSSKEFSSSKSFSSSGNSSSSGQSSKGAPSSPTLSNMNADRRLQIMKKKAATKLQEKRKSK